MKREQISLHEFEARLAAQGVPCEHYAFKCVRCGHVQSATSLVKYMDAEQALQTAYFSCEGRMAKGVGCDWTLGGLFKIHTLEVLTQNGIHVPAFELASPEEAQALMSEAAGSIRKCRVCGCDDFHACADGCCWVEPDLCSACKGKRAL